MKAPSVARQRLFIAALIPSILLLTPAGMILGIAIQGGQLPIEGMALGTIDGFLFMLWATAYTLIAWQHQKWFQIKISLIVYLLINFWWVPIALYENFSTHPESKKERTFG